MKLIFAIILLISGTLSAQHVDIKNTLIEGEYKLPNLLPALNYEDDLIYKTSASEY